MSENVPRPTSPLNPERKVQEIPKPVSVKGNKGRVWQGPIQGKKLMWAELPPSHATLADWVPPYTEIALRMSDGNINLITVREPHSRDNPTRGYFLTNVAMNQDRSPGQPIMAVELSPGAVKELTIERGQPLTIRNPDETLVSEGTIDEIVTYDRKSPEQVGRVPSSTIADDFLRSVGALPFGGK